MEFLEDTDWGNELVEKLIKVEAHQDAKKDDDMVFTGIVDSMPFARCRF